MHGLIKAATALVSAATAIALFKNLTNVVNIPTLEQLEAALVEAAEEKLQRQQMEAQRKSEIVLNYASEQLDIGLLVIDKTQTINIANKKVESLFKYDHHELIGKPLSILIEDELVDRHHTLASKFLQKEKPEDRSLSARLVTGVTKNGDVIVLEVTLSVMDYEENSYAIATLIDVNKKHAEQIKNEEHQRRMQRAVNATRDGLWERDIKTGKVWFSDQFLNIVGQSGAKELHYDMWLSHIHPEDLKMFENSVQEHLESNVKFDVIYRGKTKSGEYEWMRARGNTISNAMGKPILMSGSLDSIHELKTLELRLEESTNFLNSVLDRTLAGIYIYDLKERTLKYINPEFTKITGYALKEMQELGSNNQFMNSFHPDDQEKIVEHLKQVARNRNDIVEVVYRFRHQSGHWIWCYSRDLIYSYDEQGKPLELLGSFFEISDLKNRELEMHRLALDYATIFEQAAIGIAHLSTEGRFIKINEKLCDLLGHESKTLESMNIADVAARPYKDSLREKLVSMVRGRDRYMITETRLRRSDNTEIWILLSCSLVIDELTKETYFIAAIEDISLRKRMELDIAESNESLERFAYSASHDLQEPLRKLSSFSSMLMDGLKDREDIDSEAMFQLDRIRDAAQRMSDMISSLLTLSRYSRSSLERDKCSLHSLIDLVLDDLSELIGETGAKITIENDARLYVEKNSFQLVLRNLLINSIHYCPSDSVPEINIDSLVSDGTNVITICDNGIGLDEDQVNVIFEPFKRLAGKTTPGSGMGLAICRQIVKAHGGKIRAKGRPGNGAMFIIELPQN